VLEAMSRPTQYWIVVMMTSERIIISLPMM
jgi:hypothetical protein